MAPCTLPAIDSSAPAIRILIARPIITKILQHSSWLAQAIVSRRGQSTDIPKIIYPLEHAIARGIRDHQSHPRLQVRAALDFVAVSRDAGVIDNRAVPSGSDALDYAERVRHVDENRVLRRAHRVPSPV